MKEIYLDNAATTRPWPEVIEAMEEAMSAGFGNSSSLHRRGLQAARKIHEAKESILKLIGSGHWEVIFTSGGTEADNLAVFGSVPKGKRNRTVISTVEHAAVTESCRRLGRESAALVEVSAGVSGVVDPNEMEQVVSDRTALVALNHVANEMGTVQKVAEVSRRVKDCAPKCRVHVDGVQALAQLSRLDYPETIDSVAISAHKIHGPQGVGALLVRPGVSLRPMIAGGDQQGGHRPGTMNLPGIVGFAKAADILNKRRQRGVEQMKKLTDELICSLTAGIPGIRPLGDPSARAPGMAILAVEGVRSEVLLHALEDRGVFASSGSACHSTRKTAPRCLIDAGLRPNEGALRLSLSLDTTSGEIAEGRAAMIAAIQAVSRGRIGEK